MISLGYKFLYDSKVWRCMLQDLRVSENEYKNFNPKDPAALLKDLARNGGSKLRPALNSKIERGFLKNYYEI
jgi:hypothetical protein